ncbi:MAG: ATP-dependent Clp protease proteolytic subunit [Armatimonadetes bacterium]|nr:ATP-dependent Clp protease proteolytic subunit [Akkermansiaceae bacterium]
MIKPCLKFPDVKLFLCLLSAILGLLPGISHSQQPASIGKKKVIVIPIRAQIAPPELFILRRGLKTAIEQGADTVILDMETPGGRLDITFDMLKAIERFPGKVVTYVNREAISAGALISAGTDEIYFSPGAVIGAAAPVSGAGQDIDATMKLKIVSYLKAVVRSVSEDKGYRGEVISAMIDEDYELKIGEDIIKPKGELLTLTAVEAVKKYGDPAQTLLGAGIEPSLESLMDTLLGKENYSATRLEITWSEKIAQYLTTLTPILLAAGLLLIFIEFKTPGFGIFGIGGGIFLAIVFFGHYAAGLSGHEPALFFALGLALVIIDLFFIPGLFVLAIPGALLMFGSLIWGMSDIWPKQPIPWNSSFLARPMINLIAGVGGAILMFALLLRFMPSGGLWGKMVLTTAIGGETTAANSDRSQPSLIGRQGLAVTGLFPSGQIEISGKRYDARLTLGTASPGTEVTVVSVGEFELKVEPLV